MKKLGIIDTLEKFRQATKDLPGDTPLNFRHQPAQNLFLMDGILFYQEELPEKSKRK